MGGEGKKWGGITGILISQRGALFFSVRGGGVIVADSLYFFPSRQLLASRLIFAACSLAGYALLLYSNLFHL